MGCPGPHAPGLDPGSRLRWVNWVVVLARAATGHGCHAGVGNSDPLGPALSRGWQCRDGCFVTVSRGAERGSFLRHPGVKVKALIPLLDLLEPNLSQALGMSGSAFSDQNILKGCPLLANF